MTEMPYIILSTHPEWWEKIRSGEKTLEIRKTAPARTPPFRVFVYVTGNIGVVGEIICDSVIKIDVSSENPAVSADILAQSRLSVKQLIEYRGHVGNRVRPLFGWHISEVKVYEKPVSLSRFGIPSAPQSWCYANSNAASITEPFGKSEQFNV